MEALSTASGTSVKVLNGIQVTPQLQQKTTFSQKNSTSASVHYTGQMSTSTAVESHISCSTVNIKGKPK